MKVSPMCLLCLRFLLGLLCAGAPFLSPQRALAAETPASTSLKPREEILPNGLRVGAMRGGRSAREAVLSLSIRVGSYAEEDGERGFAHLVEHLAFEGGQGLAGEVFREDLERRGAYSEAKGWTSFYHTVYCFPFDPTKEEARSLALAKVRDLLFASEVSPVALERAKAVVLREMAEDESHDKAVSEEEGGILGTMKSIEGASPAGVSAFKARWYRPELSAVYLVGDLEPEAGLESLRAVLSALPPGPGSPDPGLLSRRGGLGAGEGGRKAPYAWVEKDWDGGSLVRLLFPLEVRRSHDGRARAREGLAARLLGSRLARGLGRSEHSIWKPEVWVGPEGFSIEIHAKAGSHNELVAGLGGELLLALKGFKAREVEAALAEFRGSLERALAAERWLSALELAHGLADRFGCEGTPFNQPAEEEFFSALADPRLAAEALAFLRSTLDLESLVFDAFELPKSAAELTKAWESRRARPMKVPAAPPLPALPEPLPPAERWEDPRSGTRLLKLANGALVALFPARSGEARLGLWALSPGGYLSRPGLDPTLLRLADEVPAFFGIATLPGSSFSRELGARGAELWFSLSARHEEIGGAAPSEELEPFLRLLHGALRAPGGPAQASFAALVSAFDDQADSYDLLLGVSSADRYGGGPAFAVLGGKAAASVDPAALPAAFRDRFGQPADFIWLLGGLPDLDKAEALVASALGSIPRLAAAEVFPERPRPLRSGILDRSGDDLYSDRRSVDFRIELPLGALEKPGEGLALRTLAKAFRADLYETLREVELAVYSLDVELWEPSVAGGGNALYLRFSCQEAEAGRIAGLVEEEVRRLAAGQSSPQSLAKAIRDALHSYEEQTERFESWLEVLAGESPNYGGPRKGLAALGQSLAAAQSALEPEALRELARRLVKGDDLFLRISK